MHADSGNELPVGHVRRAEHQQAPLPDVHMPMNDHLVRVRIRDYQSLADVEFVPGPLTIVTGDNDAGKTAIMRALRAACFNETGNSNIRRSQERAQVVLEFDDDVYLRWTKVRDGGAEYLLVVGDEEQKFSKLGAAVPEEVQAALRIREIDVSKDWRIAPQFHPQEEYYFLIDRPEGQAARALAKMTKLDVVVEAQQLIRTDLKRAKADLRAATDNIAQYESTLTAYEGLDADIRAAALSQVEVTRIHILAGTLDSMRAALDAWQDVCAEIDEAANIPTEDDIALLKGAYNQTREWVLAFRTYTDAADALAALPETIPDIPDLSAQYERLTAMQAAYHVHYVANAEAIDIEDELRAHDEASRLDIQRWNELETCPECGAPLESK